MKKIFLACLVTISAATAQHAIAQLPDSLLLERISECDLIGVDWNRMNSCYTQIAIERNDPSICDNIKWSANRVACKRRILYENSFSLQNVFPQLPFYIFLILFAVYLYAKPPRSAYIMGAIVGSAFAGLLLYSQVPGSYTLLIEPYIPMLTLPVQGILTYAPPWFHDLSYTTEFLVSHIIIYGLILGILFRGEKKTYSSALLIACLAVLFSVWMYPQMDIVRQTLQSWYDTILS